MPVAVITGANSGIGNAWAALLVRKVGSFISILKALIHIADCQKSYTVYALDVSIGSSITNLGCEYFQVDVTSPGSIAKFRSAFGDRPVDMLLNVAGIMAKPDQDALKTTTLESLSKLFAVNASGPFLLTQTLLPNLLAAGNAKIGIVSTRVSSMTDNTGGSLYAYRASKAAVNAIGVSLSVDLRPHGIMVVLLHPGINSTNLAGGAFAGIEQAFEPADTAERLFKVMDEKTIGDTGKFFQYEGLELPW